MAVKKYLLWIYISTITITSVLLGRSLHAERIQSRDALEDAWELFQQEMVITENQKKEIAYLTSINAELEENMDRLASLKPVLGLIEPDEAFTIIEDLEPSTPFDSGFKITSRVGQGPGFNGSHRMKHTGTDIVPEGDWYVRSLWPGRVVEIGIDRALGKFVVVEHSPRVRTVYAHLETIFYSAVPESEVDETTRMGVMGSTGYSDAAHLHLELQIFDGFKWEPVDVYPFLNR